jgi:hypothetical protein
VPGELQTRRSARRKTRVAVVSRQLVFARLMLDMNKIR